MAQEAGYKWKLGMFVIIGLLLFTVAIYLIGKQQNLFGSTFQLKTQFKTVSGLQPGNNIRFSGITIGTIDNIKLHTDTSVIVTMTIKDEYKQFIKTDATASIGSDGLMGEKILTITPGTNSTTAVKNNDLIVSKNPVEMADIMNSLKASVDNAGVITGQLAEVSYKINNGNGVLAKLISDDEYSNNISGTLANLHTSTQEFAEFTTNLNDGRLAVKLDSTMTNLQEGTKGLSENMEAVKHSFLLRGYFRRKAKADAKKQATIQKQAAIKKQQNTKTLNRLKNVKDSIK